jgi:wyosine [tRNA(Phe)-imidazoG37] synthetase (radical SAM superfamily)
MSCVFGPVPSRRLGRSLGVDTVPLKTCNWNCVYCQLGRSTPIVHERKEYLRTSVIHQELADALRAVPAQQIDWITFVASGEGTLHVDVGDLVRQATQMTDIPVAVVTNGSLLHLDEVREGLAAADAVMPTLDAADPDLYRRINRPHPAFTFDQHVEGLRRFARMRRRAGLWIEVMLVSGLNDTLPALTDLRRLLDDINPDQIHLTLPTRCPAEPWVQPPDHERLMVIQTILGPRATLASTYGYQLDLSGDQDLERRIADIVSRHPLRLAELEQAARRASIRDLNARLTAMHKRGLIELARRGEETFVCTARDGGPRSACGGRIGAPPR